ncbi:30S ribosome-binding factor RbfA [Singulisphaera sp. PoT]|uniref:30S ribosome-binding factor RbfA n=1 Tax=Singulisphaera sp. PoT TaxID=3411797 RepID=UPI003BF4D066
MSSHRNLRLAEAIREVVASAILFELSDPRVHSVTVLKVELASDLRNATVFVSIMGSKADQDRTMAGLRSACGFLQSRVAARLQTRFTPILGFKKDESIKKSVEISKLIDSVMAADRQADADANAEVDDEAADSDDDESDLIDADDPSSSRPGSDI